jgi:hypothetical protein
MWVNNRTTSVAEQLVAQKTSFTPNFNNRTTSVAGGYGIKTTLLPY